MSSILKRRQLVLIVVFSAAVPLVVVAVMAQRRPGSSQQVSLSEYQELTTIAPQPDIDINELPVKTQKEVRSILLEGIYGAGNRVIEDIISKLDPVALTLLDHVFQQFDEKKLVPSTISISLFRRISAVSLVNIHNETARCKITLSQVPLNSDRTVASVVATLNAGGERVFLYVCALDDHDKWHEASMSHPTIVRPSPKR